MWRRLRVIGKVHKRWLLRTEFIKKCREYGLFALVPLIILSIDNRIANYKKDKALSMIEVLNLERSVDKRIIGFLEERVSNNHDFTDEIQLAFWEKVKSGHEFVMIDLNTSAELLFDTSNREYRGRTDFEMQPRKTAQIYYSRDSTVIAQWKTIRSLEPFIYKDSSEVLLYVKTWPAKSKNDTVVRSFTIPMDSLLTIINRNQNKTTTTIDIVSDSLEQ